MCIAGCGFSTDDCTANSRAQLTTSPATTDAAASRRFAGVIRFSAPFSSSAPQRPQFFHALEDIAHARRIPGSAHRSVPLLVSNSKVVLCGSTPSADNPMSEQAGKIICGERVLPIAEMLERANRAARGLRELGIEHDDAIAVLLRNDFPFFEAAYAANRLGVHLVPINWHFSGPEVAYILEDSGAKALVAHADLLEPIRAHIPASVRVFIVETPPEIAAAYSIAPTLGRSRAGDTVWETWLTRFEPLASEAVASPGSMIYTSGTTGRPKGVRRKPPTPEEAAGMGQMVDLVMDFSQPNIVALLTAPMYHADAERILPSRHRHEFDADRRAALRRTALSGTDRSLSRHLTRMQWLRCSCGCCGCPRQCASVATSVR
jgi:hypothetical protein